MTGKKLHRSTKEKMIAGVCGGLAEYFEIDPTLIRLIFVILLFTTFGFWIYLIMWIITPIEEPDRHDVIDSTPDPE